MQISTTKILISLVGTLLSFVVSLPADVHRAAGVAVWFLILDLASGIAAARIRGQVTSRQLRLGLKDKLTCYAVIIGFALGLSILVGRPEWYSFAVWGVCLTEALSILENLRPILRMGGSSMMPLARFLDTAAEWIERITGTKADAILATVPQPLTVPATDASGAPQELKLSVTPASEATAAEQESTPTGKEESDARDSETATDRT